MLQRHVLGRRLYTGVSGKGDAGVAAPLPNGVRRLTFAVAIPWAALTALIYALALAGGFAEVWGRDFRPTLRHYAKAFAIESTPHGLLWSGSAWHSLWTTLELASVAAPLTAALGLLIAYVLVRQPFHGRSVFEFVTMLSFAIPGTVIGLSYIFAFNVPPIELTGTGAILVICFIFRNTLGGGSATTLRRVILPLLRPALVAALVYSFVRAMTTVSAIIFLVSAEYDLATTYIISTSSRLRWVSCS
jgi:iron(III) transport system permease protein